MISLLKQPILFAALLLVFRTVSSAAVVSIVITNNDPDNIAATTEAGADLGLATTSGAATNWNNITADTAAANTALNGFVDETGTAVSTDFSITIQDNGGIRQNNNGATSTAIGYNGTRLFSDYTGGNQYLTLTNTEALFGSGTYDLLLYLGRQSNQGNDDYSMTARLDDSPGTEQTIALIDGNALVTTTSPLAGAYVEGQQYLRISGISVSSGNTYFDVFGDVNGGSTDQAVVGAIQLVSVIPEPGSLALLGLALGALLLIHRRK